MTEKRLAGIGVLEGIIFGRALLFRPHSSSNEAVREFNNDGEAGNELEKLQTAKKEALAELAELVEKTKKTWEKNRPIFCGSSSLF